MPASPFVLLLTCSWLAITAQAAWLVTFSVYLAESHPALPASTIAAATVAASYAVSVLLERCSSVRGLRYALVFSSVGLACFGRLDALAVALVAIGTGLSRPSYQRLVAALRPEAMSASRAFAIYSVVANLAYFLGGFGADLLRRFFGWQGLFGVGAFCTLVATAATLWLREPQTTGSRHRDEAIPLGLSAWGLLAAVAAYFLASAQFQTVLPLVVEAETVSGGWLRAGSLGAVHGLGVLCLTLGQSARSGSEGSPMVLACGIAVIGACFWLLAILHYPTTPSWILVVVALMSAGETLVGAHMLALGSRLAGLGRSAYWLASALGYCASAVWAVKWHAMSHASFFAAVAAACVLVSLWVLLAFRKR